MKKGNPAEYKRKKYSQRTLIEFDDKLRQSKSADDPMFDRQTRNSTLRNKKFSPPSGTLFEAIYRELKDKEQREKQGRSYFKMLFRLRQNRAKRQFIGSA
jgi:hypothetical protein